MEEEWCGALVVTERFMHVGGKNQHWERLMRQRRAKWFGLVFWAL